MPYILRYHVEQHSEILFVGIVEHAFLLIIIQVLIVTLVIEVTPIKSIVRLIQ